MKMEWKLFNFSEEKRKWNENMKMEFCGTETKTESFSGSENENEKGTATSGGTDADMKIPFIDAEFPFYGGFAWSI
jgi:hypothetical protein